MNCAEASSILRPLQDQFALRYYDWCLGEGERELKEDFPRVRRVKSSLVNLFLEFVENHSRNEVRDLMIGGVKRFKPRAVELRNEHQSEKEKAIHQQFVDFFSEDVLIHGNAMKAFRVSRHERELAHDAKPGSSKRKRGLQAPAFLLGEITLSYDDAYVFRSRIEIYNSLATKSCRARPLYSCK